MSWRRFGFALELINCGLDHDQDLPWMLHIHLLWLNVFIHLPLPLRATAKDGGFDWEYWGVSCHEGIRFQWGSHSRYFDWPWMYRHIRHEVRRADGSWVQFVGSWEVGNGITRKDGTRVGEPKEPDGREEFEYPYHYLLRNWTVQERTAKVYVERWVRRQHWLKFTSWFDRTRYSINVEFSDEVGEKTGSWKGGCIGCGWNLKRNETPEKALRRMEHERKF